MEKLLSTKRIFMKIVRIRLLFKVTRQHFRGQLTCLALIFTQVCLLVSFQILLGLCGYNIEVQPLEWKSECLERVANMFFRNVFGI